MELFSCLDSRIAIGNLQASELGHLLNNAYKNAKIAILVDENTKEDCLPLLFTHFGGLTDAEIIELPAGEINKSMEICFSVWEALTEMEFGRNDLIICLGGGVICDMGGFIASIYKRGMRCIYIPTSLLAMVDASLGGKTGVDLGPNKNQLGTFAFPSYVFIETVFLTTLPEKEKKNGLAEMLKHGLIANKDHFYRLAAIRLDDISEEDIAESLKIKKEIVEQDPTEKGQRKLLNFGHTVGHAIEGTLLNTTKQMDHGLAVAHGMWVESYLSYKMGWITEKELVGIETVLKACFTFEKFTHTELERFVKLIRQDKKNVDDTFRFTLLKEIGAGVFDVEISEDQVKQALNATLSTDA